VTRAIKAPSSVEVGHRDVLAAAVEAIGGTERPGQVEMADAIAKCLDSDHHLLVQAGTGTGKSLAYLAPTLLWLVRHPNKRIIVATATLALQSQLANNDIPAALDAVESVTGSRPRHAILKGRANYVCLLRLRDGTAQDQGVLIPAGDLIETIRSSPQSMSRSRSGSAWVRSAARTVLSASSRAHVTRLAPRTSWSPITHYSRSTPCMAAPLFLSTAP
jgi:ATP-dependent DNA helicase DinG